MKNRKIADQILSKSRSKTGRIIVLTGARQTGKTTLARRLFREFEYITIDDPVTRSDYARLTAAQWRQMYPKAILDEVQKEPALIESVKAVYDQWSETAYVLLGSSQLLLLDKVRESLAGRCSIIEIYPLTLPELRTGSWDDPVADSLLQEEISGKPVPAYLPSFYLDKLMPRKMQAWEHYLLAGAYPAVSDSELSMPERRDWLKNYVRTYLERDIRDLASFRNLDPFVKLQKLLALQTGQLLNLAALAIQTGLTAKTVRRYIQYFEISYQVVMLAAWSRNQAKRLVKMPKLHYTDHGVLQAVLQKTGPPAGNEFESLVVAEIYKQVKALDTDAAFYHLRTHDGREVDLLVELPDGYFAFEIKMADNVSRSDAKHLFGIEEFLDKPLKRAFLLSNDPVTAVYSEKVVAVHAAMLLG